MEGAILSVLEGAIRGKGDDEEKTIKVKSLRKMVLLSLRRDESEKSAKKEYKKAVQSLEKEGKLTLNADGCISLPSKKSKKRKSKDSVVSNAKKIKAGGAGDNKESPKEEEEGARDSKPPSDGPMSKETEENSPEQDHSLELKYTPCKGNPQGVTRLFVGNLPFSVDEASLKSFIPGVTHIKWITDKDSGAFYGSSFVEMESSSKAADAVAKAGSQLMGRPIKINYAPARSGDIWPPTATKKSQMTKGNGGQAGGSGLKAMSVKPPDCKKLFIGNLSYDIDDDEISKFFASVDAEIKAVRWLHHKDSGDFKGCGYVEFWNPDDCSKGAALNGKNLLGRPIRIDWSD
ncbi:hypothetical protein ACA910_012881 [Epithemia clementina (nom. ined.)]